MSGGILTSKGSNTGQATGALHVQALEGPGVNPARGSVPPDTVPKMWHAHTRSVAGTAPMDDQVKPVNVYVTATSRRGAESEGGIDGVYFV